MQQVINEDHLSCSMGFLREGLNQDRTEPLTYELFSSSSGLLRSTLLFHYPLEQDYRVGLHFLLFPEIRTWTSACVLPCFQISDIQLIQLLYDLNYFFSPYCIGLLHCIIVLQAMPNTEREMCLQCFDLDQDEWCYEDNKSFLRSE